MPAVELARVQRDREQGFDVRAKAARDFWGPIVAKALNAEVQSDEPDDIQIALRNVKARRKLIAKIVEEYLEKHQTLRKSALTHRKSLRLSKSQIAILNAARLTPLQEEYWRLHIEYGLGPTAIARTYKVHPSTVHESLKASNAKIERVRPRGSRQ